MQIDFDVYMCIAIHVYSPCYYILSRPPSEREKTDALSVHLLEAEGYSEVVTVEREGLLSKVAALEEECQERCRLSNEWFENLKVSCKQ